jgi:hypothetical protein
MIVQKNKKPPCKNYFHLFSFIFGFVFLSSACKLGSNSKPRALESNDWFKDGKDRFYLASLRTNENLEGSVNKLKLGSEMIFGVGCFGEPKDISSFVEVPPGPCSEKPRSMRLTERTYVDEFFFAKDPSKPNRGECVLLLGDANTVEHIKQFPKEYNQGPGGAAWTATAVAAGTCALSTMIFVPSIRGSVVTKLGAAATKVKTASATQALSGQVRQRVPNVFQNLLKKIALNSASVAQTINTPVEKFFRTPLGGSVSLGLSIIPCGNLATSVWLLLAEAQTNKNLAAFYKAMAETEKLTATDMAKSEWGQKFTVLAQKGNYREAAAVYNPQFVKQFNRKVFGTVEQGWFRGQRFFDTVKEINTQLNQFSAEPN